LCNNQWNGKKNRNDQSLLHGKALQPPTQSCREYHCYQAHSTQTCPRKLQNVMAVTDVLAQRIRGLFLWLRVIVVTERTGTFGPN
jgi:hypothetical protein